MPGKRCARLSASYGSTQRVARGSGLRASRLAGRVRSVRSQVVGSGPVGERATPTPGQDPLGLCGAGGLALKLLADFFDQGRGRVGVNVFRLSQSL
jgi:hypothetical protein